MRYALVDRSACRAAGFVCPFEPVEITVQLDVLQSELRYSAGCLARKVGVTDRFEELGGWSGTVHQSHYLSSL